MVVGTRSGAADGRCGWARPTGRAGGTTGAAIKDGRARWTRKGAADEDGRGGRRWGRKRVAQQAADEDSRPAAAVSGRNTGVAAIAVASSTDPGTAAASKKAQWDSSC